MRPSRSVILDFLRAHCVPEEVVSHSIKVESKALEIGRSAARRGTVIDLELVSLGALLHDIGRAESHDLDHGFKGGEILRSDEDLRRLLDGNDVEALARICERHIGAGIPPQDAARLGLPERDYLPQSWEEKVVTHADNLVWDGVLTEEQSLSAFEEKLGRDSPILQRIGALAAEIRSLTEGGQ